MAFDHARIRRAMDRRESLALVEALLGCTDPSERSELVRSLAVLDDPRTVDPLTATLLDRSEPAETRNACADALEPMLNAPVPPVREWWGADTPLRRAAAQHMTDEHWDLLGPLVAEPHHPLHGEAIAALAVDLRASRATPALVEALRHPSAPVRATAARTLVWAEPVAATEPLAAAARDPEAEVAVEALHTLQCYPTVAAARAALDGLDRESAEVRAAAESVLGGLGDAVSPALRHPRTREAVRRWLGPIMEELDVALEPPEPVELPPRRLYEPYDWLRSLEALDRRLGTLDAEWADRKVELFRAEWDAVPQSIRPTVVDRLLDSSDAWVRSCAPRALASWGAASELVALTRSEERSVARNAIHHLQRLPEDPALAEWVWETLVASGHHGAIRSAIALGSSAEVWQPGAVAIVLDDQREEAARAEALFALTERPEALKQCLPILDEPPSPTWLLHVTLVDAAIELGLPIPALRRLRHEDHLEAQRMAALSENAR